MNGSLPPRPASAGTPPLPSQGDRKRVTLVDDAPPPSKRAKLDDDSATVKHEQDDHDDDMPEEDRKLEVRFLTVLGGCLRSRLATFARLLAVRHGPLIRSLKLCKLTRLCARLQSFRKEAIYREMLSYKRQLHRALSDASTLRSQRTAYEVRLSRVELAWNALVSEADLILPSTRPRPRPTTATARRARP